VEKGGKTRKKRGARSDVCRGATSKMWSRRGGQRSRREKPVQFKGTGKKKKKGRGVPENKVKAPPVLRGKGKKK